MNAKRQPRKKNEMPRVHPDLQGFNIEVNSFGEVKTNYDLDKLNLFLNQNVKDKKFRGRDDIEGVPDDFKEAAEPEEELKWGETSHSEEDKEEESAELPPTLRDMDSEQDIDDLMHEK